MKRIYQSFFLLLALALFLAKADAQVTVTATTGKLTGSYATLKNCFDSINYGAHRGAIVITIHSNVTETATARLDSSSISTGANYTSVLIKPADTATVTKVISTNTSGQALVDFNGADNVTIEGRVLGTGMVKRLTFTHTRPNQNANSVVIRLINGVSRFTMQHVNCTSTTDTTTVATPNVLFSGSASTTGNFKVTIDNCAITGGVTGVNMTGTTTNPMDSISITNNTITNVLATSVSVASVKNLTLAGNTLVHTSNILFGWQVNGIVVNTTISGSNYQIHRNRILNLGSLSGANSLGIVIGTTIANPAVVPIVNITNNYVALLKNGTNLAQVRAFVFQNAGPANVTAAFNTFRVGGSGNANTGNPATCTVVKNNNSTSSSFTFLNNVCMNTRTGGANPHIAYWNGTPTVGTNITDYNTYWGPLVPAAMGGSFVHSELDLRTTAAPNEQNSTVTNLSFVDSINPDLVPGALARYLLATPFGGVTSDIHGTPKATYPYRGAFEGAPLDTNDATVAILYTYGKIAAGTQDTVKALVRNNGVKDLTNRNITLTGSTSGFTGTYTIPLIRALKDTLVLLTPYTPSVTGTDTLKVTLPNDQNNTNNIFTQVRENTSNTFSYRNTLLPNDGNVGTTGQGEIIAKFNFPAAKQIGNIRLDFTKAVFTPDTFQVVIYEDSVTAAGPKRVARWVSPVRLTVNGIFTEPVSGVTVSGNFYVGVRQPTTKNIGLAFQAENPLRSGSFYLRQGATYASAAWTDLGTNPENNFRPVIEVETALPVSITSQPQDQTLCAGSGAQLRVGTANALAFQWQLFTTSWTNLVDTGIYTGVTDSMLNISNVTGLHNSQFRCLAYGTDTAVSDTAVLTVHSPVSNNTITGSQTICTGSAPAGFTGSVPAGGNGSTYTYRWIRSTTSDSTGFTRAGLNDSTQNYASSSLTQVTWFKRVVTSGTCGTDTSAAVKITLNTAVTNNNITSSPQTICPGSTPSAITGSTPTGGNGTTYTYSWLSSATSATAGFTAIGSSNTSGYSPASLTATTWYKRVVTSGVCAADTTAAIAITVNAPGTWTGAVSDEWGNSANWSCPQVPASATNVIIPSGTNYGPVVTGMQQANNLTINSGALLTLNNASAVLSVYGAITNNGTFSTSNGKLNLAGSAAQTLGGGIYSKLQVNNSNGVILGNNITLNDSLVLSNGTITLGAYNLTLAGASLASAGNASSYVKTNGAGRMIVNNVGAGGKTGNVTIPVGNSSYNPVVLSNSGAADIFTVWVADSVTAAYSSNTPTGLRLTNNAVNRTWFINEATAGGSTASVTLQWNAADELSGFTRGASYVSRYNGTFWSSDAATAAAGLNPYMQTRTGITSFSPFGVGSNGALPVELLSFAGSKQQNNVKLAWSTASEKNNKGFDIERSEDGKTWSPIGFVKGNGTVNAVSDYMFTDVNPFNGSTALFYRLKQTDMNGTYTHTHTIRVENSIAARVHATVQPNPFNSTLRLTISAPATSDAAIVITDMTGRLIATQQHVCDEGTNTIEVNDVDALRPGVYFVSITINNETVTHKVVKQ